MSINKELVADLRKAQERIAELEAKIAELETGKAFDKAKILELKAENAKLKSIMNEALSNMEYYPASLGEMWLVQDSDISAMQAAALEGNGLEIPESFERIGG